MKPKIWIAIVCLCSSVFPALGQVTPESHWIWSHDQVAESIILRHEFRLDRPVTNASLDVLCEFASCSIVFNGVVVERIHPYGRPATVNVLALIKPGVNRIDCYCTGVEGPSALSASLRLERTGAQSRWVHTDKSWNYGVVPDGDLPLTKSLEVEWRKVKSMGTLADDPWSHASPRIRVGPEDDYTQWKQALGDVSSRAVDVPAGFEVRAVYTAEPEHGSLISMAQDAQGHWIISREKKGLIRVALDAGQNHAISSEVINETLAECRGLLFAHDSLYACANNDKQIFRLRDTTGDGELDEAKSIVRLEGDVGHGRNDLASDKDGRIYVICGDAVFEPKDVASLIPSLKDPSDHEKARSGYVLRFDPDGSGQTVVVRGLRNPYGIAFHRDGEMFTYDADAEYDMGSSWYRPTRVNHLVRGGDYGWRRVTRSWPSYFPDRGDVPTHTIDIGKGSPTAVAFGYGSTFPKPYHDALFVLDWAYGRIVAVHLNPTGSSYAATTETFVRGRPLNVTDLAIGMDGAMYFLTGGRGTQSTLYKVTYVGKQRVASALCQQARAREKHAAVHRTVRLKLESMLNDHSVAALEAGWAELGNQDPWIRHVARTVVESHSDELWRNRLAKETDSRRICAAMVAAVRVGSPEALALVAENWSRLDLQSLEDPLLHESLFVMRRLLTSLPSNSHLRQLCGDRLSSVYPHRSVGVNRDLSLILSELAVESFVPTTMKLLTSAQTPTEQLHYLYVLRNIRTGWTSDLRSLYFEYFKQTADFEGGEGFPRFRELIRNESLDTVERTERDRYELQLSRNLLESWKDEFGEPRPLVREWKHVDLADRLKEVRVDRDFDNGKRMFGVAKCIACHRFDSRGGVVGPDLTAASGRFSADDLLTSIVDPSRVVAEKYRNSTFALKDGRVVTGRVVSSDYRTGSLSVMTNPLEPAVLVSIPKEEIEHHEVAATSAMPAGTVNTLSAEDILDLLAYILSRGDEKSPRFSTAN